MRKKKQIQSSLVTGFISTQKVKSNLSTSLYACRNKSLRRWNLVVEESRITTFSSINGGS